MPLKIGCCGFPVSQQRYYREFEVVEIDSTFYQLPALRTIERWRKQAPADFEFTVKAWQLITHPAQSATYRRLREKLSSRQRDRCGYFRWSEEVLRAWRRTAEVAQVLRARWILFQTPPTFYPHPELLRNLYRFFKQIHRGDFLFVWEPWIERWDGKLVLKICRDLGLFFGGDPLQYGELFGKVAYARLHGAYVGRRIDHGHRYSAQELERLAQWCRSKTGCVFFNNRHMFEDARHLRGAIPTLVSGKSSRA
ncbi:MAG: DUF72 domain-containing protein [Elusimicrobia bacterium]|nr:DUF72 domain-containing protein [Elusimicrobiota bacterium]